MCGIAGIFHYRDPDRPVDRAELERMTRALAHRGPDGEGFHVDGPVGLGHRRLAILDLTPTGAQPMSDDEGARWITYNGEFYDHAAFRAGPLRAHRFRGRSDTETLLHLLREEGPDALGRISAIFGFAYWDGPAKTLTLARDALGVKQVYFHDDGARVVFASEVKAVLLAAGVERELDPEGVNQYLHFHTPLFERTFFRGVRQVRPGEHLSWTAGGARRSGRFWEVRDFAESAAPAAEQGEALHRVLAQAVSDQLMSDVPVGAFFSGGIDSTAVASFAKAAGKPPRCFGVHFSGQGVIDERPYQEAAARALGLELDLITLDGSTFPEDVARLVKQQDQPVIGPAMLPMFYVSKLAASRVKVCLGGQAADEIFGGYARYALAHPIRGAMSMLRGGMQRAAAGGAPGGPAAGSPAPVGGNLRRQLLELRTLRRLASSAPRLGDWRRLYFRNFASVPEAAWREVFGADEIVSRESCWLTFSDTVARSPAPDRGTKLLHWDLQTYLPGLFQQDDRMSMAVSLESRVPIADRRVVELAFKIPFDLKMRSGASKWILRRAVADVLPEEVLNRRKVGFDTPVERWMRETHAPFVRDVLLSRRARERGLWDAAGVERWLDRPERPGWTNVVWKVLCIELWARAYLDAA
jgi:asparagine synthase (glutamine-hydrolysing)